MLERLELSHQAIQPLISSLLSVDIWVINSRLWRTSNTSRGPHLNVASIEFKEEGPLGVLNPFGDPIPS